MARLSAPRAQSGSLFNSFVGARLPPLQTQQSRPGGGGVGGSRSLNWERKAGPPSLLLEIIKSKAGQFIYFSQTIEFPTTLARYAPLPFP